MRPLILGVLLAASCTTPKAEQKPAPDTAQAAETWTHPDAQTDGGAPTELGWDRTDTVAAAIDEEDAGAASAPPLGDPSAPTTGRVTVHAGETLALQGAKIAVGSIVYVNSPCPPGVQCIHSGIIQTVQFTVTDQAGQTQSTRVSAGRERVILGVQLRVFSVTPSHEAVIEASRAVAPQP